ncbi:hypothetical protein XENOCAPTIV_013936, partial [Xenoophorus captivus]
EFFSFLFLSTGCVLGVGLVLSALCSRGQVDQQVHVSRTLDKLLANLQDSSGQGRMLQEVQQHHTSMLLQQTSCKTETVPCSLQVLSYSVACVSVSAFSGGLIDAAKAEEVLNTLRTLTEESQQTPGFSLALGLVVHGLSVSGHGKAEDIHPRLLAAWVKILLAEGCPTMQRLAAANGLVALVGSENCLIQLQSEVEHSSQQQSRLNEVIRAVTQVYVQSLGLQQFQDDVRAHRLSLCQSLLQGLAQAMVLPNPPNHCWTILCSSAEKIFSLLPSQIQAQMEKSCFVLAYLTSQGRVPLLSLNDVIAGVLRGWPSCRVGWILLQTFYQCRLAAGTNTGVSRRMEWLLELMGHIRNIGYGATSVTCGETKLVCF